MTTQDWFFFWGTFFFISWFIFLITLTVVMVIMVKQMKEMKTSVEKRMDSLQATVEEKMNQPGVMALMSLAPLLTPLISRMTKRFKSD